MTNKLEDYFFMISKVRNHYTLNKIAIDLIPTAITEYTAFNAEYDTLMLQMANSTADTSGYAMNKEVVRKTLEDKALQVSNSLTAYFTTINDLKGRKLADYPTSYFLKANAEDLIARCVGLHLLAEPIGLPLVPFGVTVLDVQALETTIDAYVIANPEGSLAIDIRKQYAIKAEQTRLKIMDRLVNKIDVLLRVVQLSNDFLYNTYLSARAIDTTGTPTAPAIEGSVSGPMPVVMGSFPYNPNREFRLQVLGGDALWGLGNMAPIIENAVPIVPGDDPRLQSSTLNPNGDFVMIQAVNPVEIITYKLWVYED